MIGFGFFTLIFFCMFNTMGVTAEKKTLQTLPPPPSICISFCEVIIIPKSNNIYIFDKKISLKMLVYYKGVFQIDKCRYENSIYFKTAYKFIKTSSLFAHNLFVFSNLKNKRTDKERKIKKKNSIFIPHCRMPICLWILHES